MAELQSTPDAERAEARFQEALEASGARDPREYYRERLKELKSANPAGYESVVGYYGSTLIPTVASDDSDPLAAWLEYGRVIAETTAPGRAYEIDTSGRRSPYSPPTPHDRLVLHLPDSGTRALLVGLPIELSDAQRSTFDLLVQGKLKLRGA